MNKKYKTVLAVLFILMIAITIIYAYKSQRITNYGTVKTVGVDVFWDSNCSNPVTIIDWEKVGPDSINTKIIYVRNSGNCPSYLNMSIDNWNPDFAFTYLSVSWNYSNQQLTPNQTIPLELTLSVSPVIQDITSFSFDITVSVSDIPIPLLPEPFESHFKRIRIYDKVYDYNYTSEYKVLAHVFFSYPDGVIVEIFELGLGKIGGVPYFDILMELAYDTKSHNMNCVITNKGDNVMEVYVDSVLIGTTEQIDQSMVHWNDEPVYVAQKWLSFNFRP